MHRQTFQSPTEAFGQSEVFLDFQEKLSRVAPIDRPVLLLGERGTGKELAASRLHFLSKRWEKPFITLNCATLSATLIESELFGYEKGAFTGAESRRQGRFESADGGTLFLDEIGTIPIIAQEKILRVVEYGVFERVGSSQPIEVDVRIICATNADLQAMAERGEFKRDLLDRLSFEVLFLPPLRHRGEDIMLLADYFAARMTFELGKTEPPGFTDTVRSMLEKHPWAGNVRELKNVIERAVYRTEIGPINRIDFDPFAAPFHTTATAPKKPPTKAPQTNTDTDNREQLIKLGSLKEAVSKLEVEMVNKALASARFNRRRAAELLHLTYDQLRGLLRKHANKINT